MQSSPPPSSIRADSDASVKDLTAAAAASGTGDASAAAAAAAASDGGDFESMIKVLICGNGGVGKSSMTARFCKGVFTAEYKKTIGVDYLERAVALGGGGGGGETARLMVWDTAGQEEFGELTATYYRGAGACALVFSTVDRASFDALDGWKARVEAAVPRTCALALVQNKADLAEAALMTDAEVAALAARWRVPLFKTCVKDDVGVDELFAYLAKTHLALVAAAGAAGAGAGAGAGAADDAAASGGGAGAMPVMGSLSGLGAAVAAPAESAAVPPPQGAQPPALAQAAATDAPAAAAAAHEEAVVVTDEAGAASAALAAPSAPTPLPGDAQVAPLPLPVLPPASPPPAAAEVLERRDAAAAPPVAAGGGGGCCVIA